MNMAMQLTPYLKVWQKFALEKSEEEHELLHISDAALCRMAEAAGIDSADPEDLAHLSKVLGVERVLFGSDYPHPEGLAEPARYIDELDGMTLADQALIMGGNLARLLKV